MAKFSHECRAELAIDDEERTALEAQGLNLGTMCGESLSRVAEACAVQQEDEGWDEPKCDMQIDQSVTSPRLVSVVCRAEICMSPYACSDALDPVRKGVEYIAGSGQAKH